MTNQLADDAVDSGGARRSRTVNWHEVGPSMIRAVSMSGIDHLRAMMNGELPGKAFASVEIKVNYLKAILLKSGLLRATGTVVQSGSRVAFAECVMTDESGVLVSHRDEHPVDLRSEAGIETGPPGLFLRHRAR
ncbi:MAG TPA: PaaI family thioesterase [Mycobacterium sp.]